MMNLRDFARGADGLPVCAFIMIEKGEMFRCVTQIPF